MDIKDSHQEHEDLEERFQISADVDFNPSSTSFEGLEPFQAEIKKKTKDSNKVKVEKIELRKSKPSRGSLF
jgi:hypothetical protein